MTPRMSVRAAAWWAAAVVFGLTACSGPGPTPSASSATPPAAAELSGLFSVGDRQLYLECRGTGSPTVLLESGFGGAGDGWAYTEDASTSVYAGVAERTRVCVYDRPGSIRNFEEGQPMVTPLPGRSDPAPMPRTGMDAVKDLHALLRSADVESPYVLTSHSFGGLLNLLYAKTYPDEVVGIVLLDTLPPGLKDVVPAKLWKELEAEFETPVDETVTLIPGYVTETYDLDKTYAQVNDGAPLPAVPVVELLADYSPDKEYTAALRKAHRKFTGNLPDARSTIVPGTGHSIHWDKPAVVIDAIVSML